MSVAVPDANSADFEASHVASWKTLDDRAEWQAFSRPYAVAAGAAESWESYLSIQGMACAACALTVERVLQRLPGVHEVLVNGASATARVRWSPADGRPSDWLSALQRAGYGALPAGDLVQAAPRQSAARQMLWRWLVAGFCMMQVMMYATPAYLAEPGDFTLQDQSLLRWASWVLTLPVVLFSCQPFFVSAWRDLRHRRIGMDVPVALGIAVAFAASSIATFDPAGPLGSEVWFDSVTMFVFFLLSGRLLEQRLRERTAGALEALMRRLPETIERQSTDGTFERVPVRQLMPRDTVRVLPGEVFPADGLVTGGESRVDEALLTGESQPLPRGPGDAVVAGSHNLSGPLLVRVQRTGADTRYAGIVALMEQASVQKPHLAQVADRVAGPFLLLVLLAAAAAAAWWWPAGPAHAIGVAVAVLIVTCPCALSLATPAASLAAAGALARHGVLVRNMQALEACAGLQTVLFDKTGTLTEDHLSATLAALRPNADAGLALTLAGTVAGHSLHPVSRALLRAAQAGDAPARQTGPTGPSWQALQSHSVVEQAGQGVQATVTAPAGAPQMVRVGSANFCGAPVCAPGASAATGPQVHLSDARGWLASFALQETLRPDAAPAVAALRGLGLDVLLLSGDQPDAVARLAARSGIGTALAAQSPEDKLGYVDRLQRAGKRVAMVGDGLNDGPVLALADVSIAMGSAVPLAQAKSDFLVHGGQLAAVPALLLQARRTRTVVRQNLLWAAIYNAVCVPLAISGAMPPWLAGLGMAGSSLLVVLNASRLAHMPQPLVAPGIPKE